jgi:membrane-bound serine protease (ClpP class)
MSRRGAIAGPGLALAVLAALVLLAAGTRLHAQIAPAAPTPPAAIDRGTIAYAHIDGPIDRIRRTYLERVIEQARERGTGTLIVHISTDGGDVLNAREMFKRVLDQAHGGPRMIAYVDDRAISAGALIAYAHDQVWVSQTASIGDIGVIYRSPEGEIKYAPEKIETVMRTLLTQAAEQRGWPRALLLKMTARNQKLYQVTLADGATQYVIEDDFAQFLSRHPDVDPQDERQVVVLRGEDRLLTLTGREALEYGMASGIARDVADLYAQLGIDAGAVEDMTPGTAEIVASWLAGVAPLLAGLAVLFVLFELKTPGVGVWAIMAALCAALFLLSQYALDLAAHHEVALIVAGLALLLADLLFGIAGGVFAIAGGLLVFAGLVLTFLPNEFEWDFSDPRFLDALASAGFSGLVSVVIVIAGLTAFAVLLPRMSVRHRLALESEVRGTSADGAQVAPALLGRSGVARDSLHPGGTVLIDGEAVAARAEHGQWIAAGVRVEVIAVEFGEVVVRAAAPADDAAGAELAP